MNFGLTDQQCGILETARDLTDSEILPRVRGNDLNEHFDLDLVDKLASRGYLGALVPEEYGGAGLDSRSYALIVEQVGRGCSGMRTLLSVQSSLIPKVEPPLRAR